MCWAANNYSKRRSEQALLWEGVTLIAERWHSWRLRVHSTGDGPRKKSSCLRDPTIGEARSYLLVSDRPGRADQPRERDYTVFGNPAFLSALATDRREDQTDQSPVRGVPTF